jgi:hypothetical protein
MPFMDEDGYEYLLIHFATLIMGYRKNYISQWSGLEGTSHLKWGKGLTEKSEIKKSLIM